MAKHKIKTYTLMLPTHWASPLVNGDETGLEDEDQAQLDAFVNDMVRTYGSCHCVDVSEDTEFMRWHDAAQYGVLACDVAEFTFFA
jgi:hypothetical protein